VNRDWVREEGDETAEAERRKSESGQLGKFFFFLKSSLYPKTDFSNCS
jgi:hypothetical protein